MPAPKSVAATLAELRALARARRRSVRTPEVTPLMLRLLGACRTLALEQRAQGVAVRLGGQTEQLAGFSITCILPGKQDVVKLTPAEQAIAELLCEGWSRAQIARHRGVSANTIKSQVRQVFRKLNVPSQVALVSRWFPLAR